MVPLRGATRLAFAILTSPVLPIPQQLASMELPEEYGHALAHTVWPGRAQVIADWGDECADNLVFCLDGAHTGESAATCAEWFADEAGADSVKVLLFNCLKARSAGFWRMQACQLTLFITSPPQEREPDRLLTPLVTVLAGRGARHPPAMRIYAPSTDI